MISKVRKLFNSKLFQDTLIYGSTNAVYSGLPLLLLPFLITILEPKDYGYVDLFRSLSMVLIPVLGLSTIQSISRFYYDLDESQFKKFVSSIQLFQLCTAVLAITLVCIFNYWIDYEDLILVLLCIVYFVLNQFTEGLLVIYRVKGKPYRYMFLRVANILLELTILTFLYFTMHHLNWQFRVYPTVLASALVAVFAYFGFRRLGYSFNFSKSLLKTSLVYSIPLVLHMLSGYVLNIGDRFFIKFYLTDEDLGNYAVAYQLGMAINFFYTSFNLAWTPTYFKWMKEKKVEQINKVRKMVYVCIPFLGVLTFLCWLCIKNLLLMESSYEISNHVVLVVLIANMILSCYKFETNYYLYMGSTRKLSVLTLASALLALILYYLLIPRIGILGAAYSTLIAFIVIYLLVILNKKNVSKFI